MFLLNNNKYLDFRSSTLVHNNVVFLFSVFYALFLTYLIPNDSSIVDRANYLRYAQSPEVVLLRNISSGYLSFLANEPVWLSLNFVLGFFYDPDTAVQLIIFFSAFFVAYYTLKVNYKYFLFLFAVLLFPQVVSKNIIHLRQGLAISIFLIGWFSRTSKKRWLFFLSTPLIHASFFFVILIYVYSSIVNRLGLANGLRLIAALLLGVSVSLSLEFLASFLGARQTDIYDFSMAEVSGLGFVAWLSILFIYCSQGRMFSKMHSFEMAAIVFYLSTYFFIEVAGRIFESMLIIVLLAGINLNSWRKFAFLFIFFFLFFVSWYLRTDKPFFGFGYSLSV